MANYIKTCFGFLLAGWLSFAPALAVNDEVPHSAEEVRPLLIGSQLPDIVYKTGNGSDFSLNEAASEKPVILVYYRGGW